MDIGSMFDECRPRLGQLEPSLPEGERLAARHPLDGREIGPLERSAEAAHPTSEDLRPVG